MTTDEIGLLAPEMVTTTKAEHRRLQVAAGDYPSGMFVRADDIREGLHPSERAVRIMTTTGPVFCCCMGEGSIFNGCISIGWPVGRETGRLLVELPRETDAGQWRIWVPEENVVADPDAALSNSRTGAEQAGERT